MRARTILSIAVTVLLVGTGVAWGGFSGTEVYLPSVGSGAGAAGSHWRTSVWITNPGGSNANVTLYFLSRSSSNNSAPSSTLMVAPGETIRIPDLMADVFAMSSAFGALRVVADQKVLVASRIYSTPSGGDDEVSTGQFFGAMPSSFAIGPGESTVIPGGFQFSPTESGPFRFNFGLVETTGHAAVVRVTATNGFDPGSSLGSKDYSLGPWGAIQKNLSDVVTTPNFDNIVLKVEVLSGPGQVLAFGSQITNGSNDPSTFEMQFPDKALGGGSSGGSGLTSVAHDGTLTGNGTTSSPLGIADGGVSTAKISAAGSTAGQVLASDGTHVVWQTPSGGGGGGGFSLPYSGSAATSDDVFHIENTGDGVAIRGISAHHDGVRGKSSAATKSGVFGRNLNSDGYGVYGNNSGNNTSGFLGGTAADLGLAAPVGAYGRADGSSGTETGVMGVSNGGTGVTGEELSSGNGGTLGARDSGVYGWVNGSGTPYAIWGMDGTGGIGFAGAFTGDVAISGDLSVQGTKNFRIDHPLDPENKYLYHAAIESDEVLDQYTGNVTLDSQGRAVVTLPDWFDAINTDFRYQLTPIGAPAPNLYIAQKIQGNQFEIGGGTPGLEVSWQVTARRDDPYLRTHPFQVERDKPAAAKGYYLAPEAWGQPEERGIEWGLHPDVMRRLKAASEARTGQR